MTKTLISVDCDPQCKWRRGVEALTETLATERASVPTHEPYAPGDVRPTKEGYAQIAQMEQDSFGILSLQDAVKHCPGTSACAVERAADNLLQRHNVGVRVLSLINDLKGNQ